MLGIPCEKKCVKCVINLLILLTKQFIFLTKYRKYDITEAAFMRFLNKNVESELYLITTKNDSEFLIKTFQKVLTALIGKL